MTQEMGALIAAVRKIADNITPNADTSGTWFAPTTVIPTRASADDPTYTITFAGVDLTSIISEGLKISWKQNALTRYGFISKAPTYLVGNTTLTILTICGDASTNYDVLNTATYAISEVKFSAAIRPLGFPMSPTLWTVSLSDANNRVQATPTINTYYNLGGINLAMPIGSWNVSFAAICELSKSTAMDMYGKVALSTSTSSVSDTDLLTGLRGGDQYQWVSAYLQKSLSVTTKTTYYPIMSTGSTIDNIMFRGDWAPTRIRMVSNYL